MTDADTLRRAAALMRERAENARLYYTAPHPKAGQEVPWFSGEDLYDFDEGTGPHILGMSPAVALAVADWLDHTAALIEANAGVFAGTQSSGMALTVARAYLGEADR